MPCGSSRRSSCGSESSWKSCTGVELDEEQISPLQLLCACKIPLCKKKSRTQRNPDREYFQCQKVGTNGIYSCKIWIWVDLVSDNVNQMIDFALEKVNQELQSVQKEISERTMYVRSIEREVIEQRRAHQEETSDFKLQIAAMQSQIYWLHSASKKFKMLRFFLLCAALCLLLVPDNNPTPQANILVRILVGHETAENHHIGPHGRIGNRERHSRSTQSNCPEATRCPCKLH